MDASRCLPIREALTIETTSKNNSTREKVYSRNRPFANRLWPLFQTESWCSFFLMKISFHSYANGSHFHMKREAPGLALKRRPKVIRKWPINGDRVSYLRAPGCD